MQGKRSHLPAGRNACPTIKHNTRVVLIDPHLAERRLWQPSLVELDEIEISPDIFATGAARFFQEMIKSGPFGGGIWMA